MENELSVPDEEHRIRAERDDACKKSAELRHEIEYPTVSRLFETQVKLAEAAKAASAKCGEIINRLRSWRKFRRNSS
jgi:hypothetical protein